MSTALEGFWMTKKTQTNRAQIVIDIKWMSMDVVYCLAPSTDYPTDQKRSPCVMDISVDLAEMFPIIIPDPTL